jgi:hypothetical protein
MFTMFKDIFKTHGKKANKPKENISVEEMIDGGDFLQSNFISESQITLSTTQNSFLNDATLLHLQAKKITSSERFMRYVSKVYGLYKSIEEEEQKKEKFRLPDAVVEIMEKANKANNEEEFYKNLSEEASEIKKLPEMLISKSAREKYIKKIKKRGKNYSGIKAQGVIERFELIGKKFAELDERQIQKYSQEETEMMSKNQIAYRHTKYGQSFTATVLGQFIQFCEDAYSEDKNYGTTEFKFEWFVDINHVKPFFEFQEERKLASNSCRNSALAYRGFLAFLLQYRSTLPYLSGIFMVAHWLGNYSEKHKDLRARGEGGGKKQDATSLMNDGNMMVLEEFKIFIPWIIKSLNYWLKKWGEEYQDKKTKKMLEEWGKMIPFEEAFDYQSKLSSGLLSFSAGLRREIIALLRHDFLTLQKNSKQENTLVTKLQREKIMRSNSANIPLANQFLMYLQIFISQVRFALLKSNSPQGKIFQWEF